MRTHHDYAFGLVGVPTDHLERLFRRLVRGELVLPLTKASLLAMGFNEVAVSGDLLLGLDARGVRAVLVAVIAERRRSSERADRAAGG